MNRYIILQFCSLFFCINSINFFAQDNERTIRLTEFANETQNWSEGFSESTGENDFNYHSLRNDLNECMLTRCTSGNMSVEWNTSALNSGKINKGAGFVWIAALDMTAEKHQFDVFVNGIKRFQVSSGTEEHWELTNTGGGKLKFEGVEIDQHGDIHGYMSLWAPESWLIPGKTQSIKITGNAENSNCWMIIYKASDALAYLQQSLKYNSWISVQITNEKTNYQILAKVPPQYCGKELTLKAGGKDYKFKISGSENETIGKLNISGKNLKDMAFAVYDEYCEMVYVNSLREIGKSTKLVFNALVQSEIENQGETKISIKGNRIYKPKTIESLMKLSQSNLARGKIYLMNSSHQDIAWMDSPEKCIIERDTMLITPLLNKASGNPNYRFDIEDALMLKEYLQRHPERKEEIANLLKNGQISCGSSYIQPYEEMYSGEALIRQFYLGAKWLKKEFRYTANTYWSPDVPGRTFQMPQILKKSGTDYMVISRMEKGIYKWYSPDGSYISTYTPGHYSESFTPIQKNFYDAAEYIASSSMAWNDYFSPKSKTTAVPILSDWDMSPAKDYSKMMEQWNSISDVQNNKGKYIPIKLPRIELSLAPDFIANFEKCATNIPSIKGERPNVWLYIHGPGHHKALSASREGDILLTVAEKFTAINSLTDNSFNNYPTTQLQKAWEAKIYPDHGWGGKHGDITDDLFELKFLFAKSEAEKIINSSLNSIASKIKFKREKGIPIVVFNSLSWKRSDPVNFNLSFEESEVKNPELFDIEGNSIPLQLSNISYYDNGSIKTADACFIAENVPSIGYKTFYLKLSDETIEPQKQEFTNLFENEFYQLKFANGGLASIFDNNLNKELIDNQKFNAGEIFTMHSEGTGAGEFSDIQQPDMQDFDKAANYPSSWKIYESGDVFTGFVNRQPIRNAVIEEKILVYNKLKRIDFVVDIKNYEGVLYREYRIAFPLNMTDGQLSYEVPFGVVNVGKDELLGAAGERYKTDCDEIHPRGIENWIGSDNEDFGITLSSSVVVADYIDPTTNPLKNQILQFVLLASRRSCHGEGNEYLQTGDHHFEFSFSSHQPGWKNGFRFGKQANEKLMVLINPKSYENVNLPEELSFFDPQDKNLIISTIKKAEEDNGLVVRLFNISENDSEMKMKSFKAFISAQKANLIEEIENPLLLQNGELNFKFGKFSIETFILK